MKLEMSMIVLGAGIIVTGLSLTVLISAYFVFQVFAGAFLIWSTGWLHDDTT